MKEKIKYNEIMQTVCEHFGVTEIAMKTKIRLQPIAHARFMFYAITKKLRNTSNPQLGWFFNQTPPNVLHGINKVKNDKVLNAIFVDLIEKIKNHE